MNKLKSNNIIRLFKISTPHADEYRERYFVVKKDIVIWQSGSKEDYSFVGKTWERTDLAYCSMWKLPSKKYKDNVYPSSEEII